MRDRVHDAIRFLAASPLRGGLAVLHRALAWYVLAIIWVVHAYFFIELLAPVAPPLGLQFHLATWVLPVTLALVGLWVELRSAARGVQGAALSAPAQGGLRGAVRAWARPVRAGLAALWQSPWEARIPLGIGLAVFGFWAGGYFGVGALGAHRDHLRFATPLDAQIPYVPQAVFVYLTVYPMALLPFLWETRVDRALRMAGSFVLTLVASYALMLLVPVALPHPAPAGPPFTREVLGLLHAGDPAWNCFPSSHCAVVMTAALALWHQGRLRGLWGFAVALAIGASTLLTRQHYVVDALAGFVLAVLVHWLLFGQTPVRQAAERFEARLVARIKLTAEALR